MSDPFDDDILTCWCGAVGRYEQLYSDDLEFGCGGFRTLHCYCGGDFCVCHHHGAAECYGCLDCEPDECLEDAEDWECRA